MGASAKVPGRWLPGLVFVASVAWLSLAAAWLSLSAVDFLYPVLHKQLNISKHVAVYGPQNRYKRDFAATDAQEHARLFGRIVRAVNSGGAGLRDLQYRNPQGHPIDQLLREPEIVHLQDVALLITRLQVFTWVMGGALLLTAGFYGWRRRQPPRLWRAAAGVVAALAGLGAAAVAVGPTDLFYQWHTWVFPAGHQWFFYYQESLMTTLMKAPDIFGYIAVLLGVWSVVLFTVFYALLRTGLRWRAGV